jgi:hypothetical protein
MANLIPPKLPRATGKNGSRPIYEGRPCPNESAPSATQYPDRTAVRWQAGVTCCPI